MPKRNPDDLATRANSLYWQTRRPAGGLADELGISRSKFYALIEPLELGKSCNVCGGPMAFTSRTDRDASRGRCRDCGAAAEVQVEHVPAIETATAQVEQESADGTRPDDTLQRRIAWPDSRDLWVTAACGVVVGLLAAAWMRRR